MVLEEVIVTASKKRRLRLGTGPKKHFKKPTSKLQNPTSRSLYMAKIEKMNELTPFFRNYLLNIRYIQRGIEDGTLLKDDMH